MNEADTRANHIDPALTTAGWGVVPGSRILREYRIAIGRLEGYGKRAPAQPADYVLVHRTRKLAVLEAKPWDDPLTTGVAQAKDYAGKLAVRFAYSSNGQGLYAIDMQTGAEGPVAAYPTPDELWDRTFAAANAWRDRFAAVPYEDKGGSHPGRYYQDIAVERVLDTVADGKDRILLTLATGTGKTFIAFQIAWKLFHARWNLTDRKRVADQSGEPARRPRILFLADRNILADQAFNAFSAFPEDAMVRISPEAIRKKGKAPKNGSLFFTIFQTFMSGPDRLGPDGEVHPSPYFGDYPPDFFDFIIIDECHRGGANDESTWRDIMEYFAPAVQLGLTATPKRKDNADTYRYFGDPVYVYSLKEGINDGYLTPFRVKQITTGIDDYLYTPDDTVIEGEIEAGRRYGESEFNKTIFMPEREEVRVLAMLSQMNPREKTLVFCATQDHALLVRDLINKHKTVADPNYCHRVTADDGALGEQHLRAFQDNEKTIPTILTTSQKLSTGVDARNIRNIVLLRPIKSMVEFKQIIGRGTRLYEGKDYFTVLDFVKAHQHFLDPEWDGEPIAPEPTDPRPEEPPGDPPDDDPDPPTPPEPRKRVVVKLADGKARRIPHMVVTTFWHPDGTPMSAQQFMQALFGRLPDFFKDENDLRRIWSDPATRVALLSGLADKGFGAAQLHEMQRIIEADNSDLFDVLCYVAFALAPHTREERASRARLAIELRFKDPQREFLNFVLGQYVQAGIEELDPARLADLLRLRYHAIADAFAKLGAPEDVSKVFCGFQRHLYQPAPAITT